MKEVSCMYLNMNKRHQNIVDPTSKNEPVLFNW